MSGGKRVEPPPAFSREREPHVRLPVLIPARLRGAQVSSSYR